MRPRASLIVVPMLVLTAAAAQFVLLGYRLPTTD
jgi:hypothetical protein